MMYKDIYSIGNYIPNKYLSVTRLFLSNNFISSLDGIDQFKNLTHLSIAHNSIEKIEELDKIYDKDILMNLSVKGNFFCKNPNSNIQIIKMFPKLRNLDGFKITESTYNVIKETEAMKVTLVDFFIFIDKKIEVIQKFVNLFKVNMEFYMRSEPKPNCSIIENQIHRMLTLIKLNNLDEVDESYIKKYLNKNINPSVHVMKKIISKFILPKTTVDNYNEQRKRQIIEKVFNDIIVQYEMKNNYNELPCYLNYLILKSSPIMHNFLISKANQVLSSLNPNKIVTPHDITIYLSKNLKQILQESTNCSYEMMKKFQFMMFYSMAEEFQLDQLKEKEIDVHYDNKQEKIDLKEIVKQTCKFLSLFQTKNFPIFALNFDYMRILTSIIQNKIEEYICEYCEIKNIVNSLFEMKRKEENMTKGIKRVEMDNNIKNNRTNGIKGSKRKLRNRSFSRGRSRDKYNNEKLNKFNYSSEQIHYKDYTNRKSNVRNRSQSNKGKKEEISSLIEKEDTMNTNTLLDNNDSNVNRSSYSITPTHQIVKNKFDIIHYNKNTSYTKKTEQTAEKSEKNNINNDNYKSSREESINNIIEKNKAIIPIVSPIHNEMFTLAKNNEQRPEFDNQNSKETIQNINNNNKNQKDVKDNKIVFIRKFPIINNKQTDNNNNNLNNRDLINNIVPTNFNNPGIRILSKISQGFDNLKQSIYLNIFTILKENYFSSIYINKFISLSKIFYHILKCYKGRILLKDLKLTYSKYISCKNIHKHYISKLFLNSIKKIIQINQSISNIYNLSLKSKAIRSLYKNKTEEKRIQNLDNNAFRYYYNQLIKKVFLSLKFNWVSSASYQQKHEVQLINASKGEEYEKEIFNFFHANEDGQENNINYENFNLMLKKGTELLLQQKEDDEIDIDIEKELEARENMKSFSPENKVDNLIDHLMKRFNDLNVQYNKNKLKSNGKKEENKNSCNLNNQQSISIPKSKDKGGKRIPKESVKLQKNYTTCPYCVSKIKHYKCIGVSNGPGELLLGAPSFKKNTKNAVFKNY